jgi:hypothetical protein
MAELAPHVIEFYSTTWNMDDDGKIVQTLQDMMDPSVKTFTEAARYHNLMLYFQ